MIMVKMALCTLIHHFDYVAVDREVEFLTGSLALMDKNNIRLKIAKRSRKIAE